MKKPNKSRERSIAQPRHQSEDDMPGESLTHQQLTQMAAVALRNAREATMPPVNPMAIALAFMEEQASAATLVADRIRARSRQ